jgi:SAM-dependent methyltransferase
LNVPVPSFDGRAYQARFDALAEKGTDIHGEASLVRSLSPATVLDAGCGTGRVAIELARHGVDVVGVDVDASMIGEARRRAPALEWVEADLAALALGRQFDVVVMAGNVPLFCPPAKRSALVEACAAHVAQGGALVAGFELGRGYGLSDYDAGCLASGLVLAERWATWDRQPFQNGESQEHHGYAVSVHRRHRRHRRP